MQLQGTTHLNFTVFAMKQLDPSMPSLSTIKKTFLPGYTPPTKVALQWHACLYAYLHMHMMLMHAWLYLQFLVLHGRKCSILCQFSNNHTQELHGKSDYFILSDSISCVSGQQPMVCECMHLHEPQLTNRLHAVLTSIIACLLPCSYYQVYEAERWWEDPRLQAPMVVLGGKHLFVGQFVRLSTTCLGKVTKILQNVKIHSQL